MFFVMVVVITGDLLKYVGLFVFFFLLSKRFVQRASQLRVEKLGQLFCESWANDYVIQRISFRHLI